MTNRLKLHGCEARKFEGNVNVQDDNPPELAGCSRIKAKRSERNRWKICE